MEYVMIHLEHALVIKDLMMQPTVNHVLIPLLTVMHMHQMLANNMFHISKQNVKNSVV